MFHYQPYIYDPFQTVYAEYTSTTTVPTFELHQTLLSLADERSRIQAQKQQLDAEERRLDHLRAATLRRLRAQGYRETIEEPEFEDIIEQILQKNRDEDRAMMDTVMYHHHPKGQKCAKRRFRGIVNEGGRNTEYRLPPARREFQRGIQVREMFDPSPMNHFPFLHFHPSSSPTQERPTIPPAESLQTPVIDELPSSHFQSFVPSQYIPETPRTTRKRGSRRGSVRTESVPMPEVRRSYPITPNETLQSYKVLRARLQTELSIIPPQSNVPPSRELQKTLQHHIGRLEDLLDEVDAVKLPTESEDDADTARKIRHGLAAEIVTAIDAIEKHIQPETPTDGSVAGGEGIHEDSDGEENALIDREIQRVIQETLARKKDEVGTSRRSVTVEDVPDAEY